MTVEILKSHRTFGGTLSYCRHPSAATNTAMRFTVFTPPGERPFAYLIYLSGLTCTEENFTTKAGAYRRAAELGLAIVAPDTSPRGPDLDGNPVHDVDSETLGSGAGLYVDATEAPWAAHYRMETYIVRDLIAAAEGAFALDPARRGLFGHSMGGHGALKIAFRHPGLFRSLSAFAPISSATRSSWAAKALEEYLGPDAGQWAAHDASRLIESGAANGQFDDILVDQGTADPLMDGLRPDLLEAAAKKAGVNLTLRWQEGYDHAYFFISTFIADHLDWHAARLV